MSRWFQGGWRRSTTASEPSRNLRCRAGRRKSASKLRSRRSATRSTSSTQRRRPCAPSCGAPATSWRKKRARRDRENEVLELIDQQRATRIRLEERLALYGEHLEEARERLGAAAEERGALARQLARTDERLLVLSEALEMQREAVVDHFHRLIEAERAASEKQVQGIEARLREGQQLLTRLREAGDQKAPEQPL